MTSKQLRPKFMPAWEKSMPGKGEFKFKFRTVHVSSFHVKRVVLIFMVQSGWSIVFCMCVSSILFVDWTGTGISQILFFFLENTFGRVKARSLSFQLGKQTRNKLGFCGGTHINYPHTQFVCWKTMKNKLILN